MSRTAAAAARTMPPCLPGFEHVKRYWDPTRSAFAAKILPGEYYVTARGELVVTVLGSCVSACIRDHALGIGGMNHFMLPERAPGRDEDDLLSAATRYGTHAMEHLINDIIAHGGERGRLEAKVVGGGRILASMTNIGARNIAFVRHYLETEKLAVLSEDLGDVHPRKVVYDPATGRAWVKRLLSQHNDTIVARERGYRSQLEVAPVKSDVELF